MSQERLSTVACSTRTAALVLLLFGLCRQTPTAQPKVYSLCELEEQGARFHGQTIRVKALYESDLLEHSGLFDPSCPGVEMPLYYESGPTAHRSIRNFQRALDGDLMDLRLRRFELEFQARFEWNSAVRSHSRGQVQGVPEPPRGSLQMFRVWTFARWRS